MPARLCSPHMASLHWARHSRCHSSVSKRMGLSTMSEQFERLKLSLADRYVIERKLGAGGMATVYLAQDLRHRRKVAVKVLRPELAATVGTDRFLQEIEIAARLTHELLDRLLGGGKKKADNDENADDADDEEKQDVEDQIKNALESLFKD